RPARRGLAGSGSARVLRRPTAGGPPRPARATRRVDRNTALVIHEIPLERRTLHGHFSRELAPVLSVDAGDSVVCSTLNAGWRGEDREEFAPRDAMLDAGHALVGPIEVRGARAGQTLAVRVDELRPGSWGATFGDGEMF